MNVLSLFDGMSCGQVALNRIGIKPTNYYASELDKYAIKVTQANYPDTIQLGDVTKWRDWDIDWSSIDLLIGGSPCQGFSFAGNRGGTRVTIDGVNSVIETRQQYIQALAKKDIGHDVVFLSQSYLFWEFVLCLDHVKVANPDVKFLLENVRMSSDNIEMITDTLGVKPVAINSDRFIDQNRERFYWSNIKINSIPKRPNWNNQYYQYRRTYFRELKSGVCCCLTANMGTGGHNVPLKSKDLKDKLTPIECERLQTVPDNYTAHVSNTQRYKMLGNGWTVDVIAHILEAGLK